jgi:drug/metabolite transporter (DMT)-like permease
MLLGAALYGRRFNRRQMVAMAVSYAGVLLAFASAVSYAVYLVYSGELVLRLGSLRLVGLATTVACLLCLLQFVLLRPLSAAAVAPEVIYLSVLNATLCTAVPVLFVMMAIERIGSTLAAQTGMIARCRPF